MYEVTDEYGNQKLEICFYERCKSYFLPKKRFAQKYCCESCRVMDYRKRKAGGLSGYKSGATNKDLSDMLLALKKEVDLLQTGSLIGGSVMIVLQLVQLYHTGTLKDLTKEQQGALNELIQKDDKIKTMWEALVR